MKITLHTILGIKQAVGKRQMEIEIPQGSTVEDVVAYMKDRWGEKLSPHFIDSHSGDVHPYVRIMINGRTIQFLDGMDTLLQEGDEVLILPLASGG